MFSVIKNHKTCQQLCGNEELTKEIINKLLLTKRIFKKCKFCSDSNL